jgi:hypothetical protein
MAPSRLVVVEHMTGTPSLSDRELAIEFDTGAGLLMLTLAQAILVFAMWVAVWPTHFGFPTDPVVLGGVAAFFGGGAVCGFYLGFVTLSEVDERPPADAGARGH